MTGTDYANDSSIRMEAIKSNQRETNRIHIHTNITLEAGERGGKEKRKENVGTDATYLPERRADTRKPEK
jgi:hypothetical protein